MCIALYPREQERPLAPAATILDPLPELQALCLGECMPVDRSWHRFCHPAAPPAAQGPAPRLRIRPRTRRLGDSIRRRYHVCSKPKPCWARTFRASARAAGDLRSRGAEPPPRRGIFRRHADRRGGPARAFGPGHGLHLRATSAADRTQRDLKKTRSGLSRETASLFSSFQGKGVI